MLWGEAGPALVDGCSMLGNSSEHLRRPTRDADLPGPGDRLGPYVVQRLIGVGGSGVVYQAEHERLERRVAIKLLRPDLAASPAMLERFLREARTVNRIGHENIVDIFDIVERLDVAPPEVYLVMELLRGQPLRERLRSQIRFSEAEAISVTIQVARALGAAHMCGVLHRDVKPENIFLLDEPSVSGAGQRRVKLLDFGALKPLGRHHDESSCGTDPGQVLGTPAYMSPEQAMDLTLDPRADVYSLGVVLYEMLAGTPPFGGTDERETMRLHVTAKPLPPSAARGQTAPLSPELEDLTLRCIAKEPLVRFQSMLELERALDACRSHGREARPTMVARASTLVPDAPISPSEIQGGPRPYQATCQTDDVGAEPRLTAHRQLPRRPWLAAAGLLAAIGVLGLIFALGLKRPAPATRRARASNVAGEASKPARPPAPEPAFPPPDEPRSPLTIARARPRRTVPEKRARSATRGQRVRTKRHPRRAAKVVPRPPSEEPLDTPARLLPSMIQHAVRPARNREATPGPSSKTTLDPWPD